MGNNAKYEVLVRSIGLIFLIVIISGCASKPISAFQSGRILEIEISKNSDKTYYLVGSEDASSALAKAENRIIRFTLPSDTDLDQCFSVTSGSKRKIFLKEPSVFKLDLLSDIDHEYRLVRSLELEALAAEREKNKSSVKASEAFKTLQRHQAFNGRSCDLPKQREMPPRPQILCGNRENCASEGGAICYSLLFGAEGCSIAAKKIGVGGFLASPSCSAAVADLAGRKYGMENVVVDALHGLADDVAHSLINSESWFDNLLGGGISLANYAVKLSKAEECVVQFVESQYAPIRAWEAQSQRIQNEPETLRSACYSLIRQVNQNHEVSESLGSEAQLLRNRIDAAQAKISALLAERRALEVCEI